MLFECSSMECRYCLILNLCSEQEEDERQKERESINMHVRERERERERDQYSQFRVRVTVAGQQARPSLRAFILKELKAAECEDLACETTHQHLMMCATYSYVCS